MPDLNVKEGFPNKLSNAEIITEMENLRILARGGGWRPDLIMAANAIIQTGDAELNNRFSQKAYRITLVLTIISVIAAIISIWFAIKSNSTDREWKEREIQLLEQIQSNTEISS